METLLKDTHESDVGYHFEWHAHSHEDLWAGHLQYLLEIQRLFVDHYPAETMHILAEIGDHEFIKHGLADSGINHGTRVVINVNADFTKVVGSYKYDPTTRTPEQIFLLNMAIPPEERSDEDVANATRAAIKLFKTHHPEYVVSNNPSKEEQKAYAQKVNEFILEYFYQQ
jgi:hypothetical protein